MPLGCAVLLTQPAPLTGTATQAMVDNAQEILDRRSPHPSRGRQLAHWLTHEKNTSRRSPHPSRGRQLVVDCLNGPIQRRKTQPAPLTGTATHVSQCSLPPFADAARTPHGDGNYGRFPYWSFRYGRSPHPSRGRQLDDLVETSEVLGKTQPAPLTGTATCTLPDQR